MSLTAVAGHKAADENPLSSQALASIPPEQLADIVLTPHPATRIVRSRFPAVSIFVANRNDSPVSRIEATEPEDALVTRPGLEVTVRHLPSGGAAFLSHLIVGETLGTAAAAAIADNPQFELSANITGMIEAGAFIAANHGAD